MVDAACRQLEPTVPVERDSQRPVFTNSSPTVNNPPVQVLCFRAVVFMVNIIPAVNSAAISLPASIDLDPFFATGYAVEKNRMPVR
ncbi:MAG TPA: hypothetical protein VGJ04_06735, partial [Pirellulales bacterium]